MQRALQIYMTTDEYETWRAQQEGRPVATAGKTLSPTMR
jgi:hypothetical protein